MMVNGNFFLEFLPSNELIRMLTAEGDTLSKFRKARFQHALPVSEILA